MIYINPAVPLLGEDAEWIDETLRGHTAAFGHLVSKYQGRLYRSMVLVSGCREEALDIVQEAFVQALLKLHTFQGRSQFYTWLYRIAYNLVVKARRWKRQQKRMYLVVEQASRAGAREPVESAQRPDRILEQNERCRQVQAALARLSKRQLAVVVLREIEGLRYEEIARTLSLPTGTVRSRLHRARLHLIRRLKGVFMAGKG